MIAVALCLLLPAVPAKAVTVRMPYEGPAALAYAGLTDCEDPVRSMGIVCLDVPRSASLVDLAVSDSSGLRIGGSYFLHDATGAAFASGEFCGALGLPLPDEATSLVVRLEGVNGPAACIEAGETAVGPATKGYVALRLR